MKKAHRKVTLFHLALSFAFVSAVIFTAGCSNRGDAGDDDMTVDETRMILSQRTVKTVTVNDIEFNMVLVEHGSFTMGAHIGDKASYDNERPTHKVTITDDYYIGETEVTQLQWLSVMGSSPSKYKALQKPVHMVNYNDCLKFIDKLNSITGCRFRLPTEAEWEFAARGGNRSKGYVYCGSDNLDQVACWLDSATRSPHSVKEKMPNELGIYDMSGNVWEWCSDWYWHYGDRDVTNPQGPKKGDKHVMRGGSWYNDNPRLFRPTYRKSMLTTSRSSFIGLRLVMETTNDE